MFRTIIAASAVVCMLTAAGETLAQSASAGLPTAARDELQEVVVTAQRRSENLQNVPISVTALSAKALSDKGIVNVTDLTQAVPGLLFGRSTNFNQPAIRGVGSRNATAGDEPNVATYIDGVYQPDSFSSLEELSNIERIEVLKGPQGTLFGRNATGGAISIVTADPTFTPKLDASGTYGRFDYRKGTLAVSGPLIGDTLAGSLAVTAFADHGYIDDTYLNTTVGSADGIIVRPKLLYKPTDKLTFELNALYGHGEDNSLISPYALYGNTVGTVLYTRPTLNPRGLPLTTLTTGRPWTSAAPSIPFAAELQKMLDGHFSYDLGWATLSGLAAVGANYGDNNSYTDASALRLGETIYHTVTNYQDQELVLTSASGGSLTWLAGVQGFEARAKFDPLISIPRNQTTGAFSPVHIYYGQNTDAWAAFAEATWKPLDKLYLTGGVRFSDDKKDDYNKSGVLPVVYGEKSWTNVSPRGVVRYELAPDSNVYASVTRGYKSGVYNSVTPTGATSPVDPEKITAYEIGIKTDIARKLRLTAAAYHYDYTDLQVSAVIVVNGGSFTNLQNAGKVAINGGEFNAEFVATDSFSLNMGLSVLRTKISDFPNAALPIPVGNNAGNKAGVVNVDGNELIRAPAETANIGANYHHELFRGELSLSGTAFYSTKYYADLANRVYQPAYKILNASATWRTPDKHYYVTVFGENLTNQVYAIGYLVSNFIDATQANKPRWFGVTLGADF